MKHAVSTLLLLVLLAIPAVSQIHVVATHAVLGELVQIVGGGDIEVETIIPAGFCPGHYDLSPGDLVRLQQADLVVYSGIEPWVEQLGDYTREGALAQLSGPWNTPADAASQVEAIAQLLEDRQPEAAGTFRANRDAYLAELTALELDLLARAEEAEAPGVPVLCMQWQTSFVSWLGFDVSTSYGPPADLSLRDLIELADMGKEAGAQLVIDNLQSGIEFGGKLAREVAAVHVVLTNFPGALPNTPTLLDMFVRNAEALFTAIEPIN